MPKWLHPSPIWCKLLFDSMIRVESTKYVFTCLHPINISEVKAEGISKVTDDYLTCFVCVNDLFRKKPFERDFFVSNEQRFAPLEAKDCSLEIKM